MLVKSDESAHDEKMEIGDKAPTLASQLEAPDEKTQEELDAEALAAAEAAKGSKTAEELAAEEAAKTAKTDEELEAEAALKVAEKIGNQDEINELRSFLREMRNENLQLKIRLGKVEGVQKAEIGTDAKPEVLEELSNQLQALAQTRTGALTDMLEIMEVNPKYEDVKDVCSADNFNFIFEEVAKANASESGKSFDEELLSVKLEVWKMPNPYRYMYETIKTYHPAYKQAPAKPKEEEKKDEKKAESAAEILARKQKAADAPGTVANLSGGATEHGGWTAAKIDALPESELHTVPKAVYKMWLNGELD